MGFASKDKWVEELQKQVAGAVLTPGDGEYEQARRAWDLTFTHHPAVILIANQAQDVVAGVRFAHETGLGVAVQSTGHGMQQPADDNMLVVTSRMKAVQVDAKARTARVEAGALWHQIIEAGAPHGLAPLLGSSPHVGVVGYTLGRGIGWLSRKYGFAADSVRWIELVTADDVLRRASPTENSDLFWGLRGGGGNFGVVTAMEFELYPVATIYGGMLTYPGELAGEALRFYREWIKAVPDELTSSIAILKFPALPQLPKELHGKILVWVRAAYAGDAAAGAAQMQPWLDWHAPESSTFREMPFSEIGTIQNDPVQPTAGFGSNELLDALSDEAIDVLMCFATHPESPVAFTELRHAGGAIARVDANSSAINHRDALLYLQLGGPTPTPELYEAAKTYIPQVKAALRPYLRGNVYLNFVKGGEARERIRDAYTPETFERLVALKAKYDPENMFRYSYPLVASNP